MKKNVDRRDFLKSSLQASAGSLMLGGGAALAAIPKDKTIALANDLPTKRFGKTAHDLPILGCGAASLSPRLADAFGVPQQTAEQRVATVRKAYDAGIRYFDTARGYADTESIYGRALKDVRDNIFIATKVGAADPNGVRQSVETSLKELQTDYLDCIQIHGQRLELDAAMKIHAALAKLRDEKMVRYIGITGHDHFDRMYKKISTGAFDQVLVAYGYFRKGMGNLLTNADLEWREMAVAKAHELGMGIVAMKVLGAWVYGHNAPKVVPNYNPDAMRQLPGAAIRWVLQDSRIQVMIIGVSLPSDVDQNVATFKGERSFTTKDRLLLADFSNKAYESDIIKNPPLGRATG